MAGAPPVQGRCRVAEKTVPELFSTPPWRMEAASSFTANHTTGGPWSVQDFVAMSDNAKLLFVLALFLGVLLYTGGYMYLNQS